MPLKTATLDQEQIDYLLKQPILNLTLNRVHFDNIKKGKKEFEYRTINEYWQARLEKFFDLEGFLIHFKNGYNKASDNFYCLCLGVFEDPESKNYMLEVVSPDLIENFDLVLDKIYSK